MKEIWIAAFRAMDDIKETVRNSGDKLCRAVASLTTRLCDVSLTGTSDAKQAMDIVLPFLLAEGIMSKVNNISKASIAIVMKLAKVNSTLQCYILVLSLLTNNIWLPIILFWFLIEQRKHYLADYI